MEQYGERGARSGLAGEVYRALMRFGNPFHDREPKPKSAVLAGAGLIAAVESLENVGRGFGGNADSGVGHLDPQFAPAASSSTRTLPPSGVWRMALSMRLNMRRRISSGSPRNATSPGHMTLQIDLLGAGGGLERAAAVCQQIVQIEFLDAQAHVAGIGAREVQQVVY